MRRKSPSPGGLRDMPCSGPATPAAHANYLACYRNEGRISRSLRVTRSVPPTLPHVWIGTSGWHYDSWRGPFFPEELRAKDHLRFVFSFDGAGAILAFHHAKERLQAKLKFTQPWVIHDIRRSLATGLQRLGVRLEVTEAVLNHKFGSHAGIVGVYQRHDFLDERTALMRWAEHVEQLIGGETAKVVM